MLKLQVGIITFGVVLVLLSCFIGEYEAGRRSSRRRRRSYTRCRNICEPGSCVSKHTTIGCGGSGGGGSVVVIAKPKPTTPPISGPEETNCAWTDNSAGRGSNRLFVPGRYTPSGCAAACREKRKTNTNINGATFREMGDGCFCEEGMYLKASFRNWKACYLVEPETTGESSATAKPAGETTDRGCNWKTGNGQGLGGKIYVGAGYTHARCAAACKLKRNYNTKINGASLMKFNRMCYCDAEMYNILTFLPFYHSCYLTETVTPTESADKGCDWKTGKGQGLQNTIYVGTGYTHARCAAACRSKSEYNTAINGASLSKFGRVCNCDVGMYKILTFLPFFHSCYLKEMAHHGCTFTGGSGLPRTNFVFKGKKAGDACIDACVNERKSNPSINGVTIRNNPYRPGCFCYYGMTEISTSTRNTMFYKACFLAPEPTAAPVEPASTAAPEEAATTAEPEEPESTAAPVEPASTAAPEEAVTTAAPEEAATTAEPEEPESTAEPEEPESTAAPEEAATTAAPEEAATTAAPEETAATTEEPLEWDFSQQLKTIEDEIENTAW